eukprot:TRINITY_DN3788_c0_g1_i1.p1 TRINITY_DN3788_c0_g1~~TRINITY_DN3788_c0_g1_i1.p1  ORF type:complete len:453 (-),score=148.56 TRINITY_DN3788_c0_g1_i1:60-1418(-)
MDPKPVGFCACFGCGGAKFVTPSQRPVAPPPTAGTKTPLLSKAEDVPSEHSTTHHEESKPLEAAAETHGVSSGKTNLELSKTTNTHSNATFVQHDRKPAPAEEKPALVEEKSDAVNNPKSEAESSKKPQDEPPMPKTEVPAQNFQVAKPEPKVEEKAEASKPTEVQPAPVARNIEPEQAEALKQPKVQSVPEQLPNAESKPAQAQKVEDVKPKAELQEKKAEEVSRPEVAQPAAAAAVLVSEVAIKTEASQPVLKSPQVESSASAVEETELKLTELKSAAGQESNFVERVIGKQLTEEDQKRAAFDCESEPEFVKMSSDKKLAFLAALGDNSTIKTLKLVKAGLTDEHAQVLSDTLKRNASLEEVNVSSNKFTSQGLLWLLDSLRENKTLKKLHMRGQSGGSSVVNSSVESAVLSMMEVNTTLTTLAVEIRTRQTTQQLEKSLQRNREEVPK